MPGSGNRHPVEKGDGNPLVLQEGAVDPFPQVPVELPGKLLLVATTQGAQPGKEGLHGPFLRRLQRKVAPYLLKASAHRLMQLPHPDGAAPLQLEAAGGLAAR